MGMVMGICFANPMNMGMGMGMIFENEYGCGYNSTCPVPAPRLSLVTSKSFSKGKTGKKFDFYNFRNITLTKP